MFDYKIVLLGDFGTGKTCLINRYVNNIFNEEYVSTIGVDISKKAISSSINNYGNTSNIIIWDIEGKTEFKPILSHHLEGSKAFVIVADLTRTNTIKSLEEHLALCEKIVPNLPICIALNKSDLEHEEIDIKSLEMISPNIIFIAKTSAKDYIQVEELFTTLGEKILKSSK